MSCTTVNIHAKQASHKQRFQQTTHMVHEIFAHNTDATDIYNEITRIFFKQVKFTANTIATRRHQKPQLQLNVHCMAVVDRSRLPISLSL